MGFNSAFKGLIKVHSCNSLLCMPLACIGSYLISARQINFKIWIPTIETLYIYVSQDIRIRGYFSKPQGVREQKSLENIDINFLFLHILKFNDNHMYHLL